MKMWLMGKRVERNEKATHRWTPTTLSKLTNSYRQHPFRTTAFSPLNESLVELKMKGWRRGVASLKRYEGSLFPRRNIGQAESFGLHGRVSRGSRAEVVEGYSK